MLLPNRKNPIEKGSNSENLALKLIVLIVLGTLYVSGCKQTNDDNPIILDQPQSSADSAEAKIWFLGQSGFAVQTPNHLLIFDYVEAHLNSVYETPDTPSLANGYINPDEIKELKVRVFTSHAHGDHYDPVILQWKDQIPDIEYFFGWQLSDNPSYHYLLSPRGSWIEDSLEVYTINSYHSDVPEVAFLIKIDDFVFYHNGDYQGNYQEDISYLKTISNNVDIAFLFGVWQEQWKYHDVNKELISQLQPHAVFPMHVRFGDEDGYFGPFQSTFEPILENGSIVLTYNVKGVSFIYKNGEIISP